MGTNQSIQTAIIKTLAYADIFNQALTTEELRKLLISYQLNSLEELIRIKSVKFKQSNNIWTLAQKKSLAASKLNQSQIAKDKLRHAQKSLRLLRVIPWIKLVGITGSVAGGTPTKSDDIDLVIITDQNRLWLSRLLLTLLLNLFNKRRKPNANPNRVSNKFCLNMWLSMSNFTERHEDIYTANELAHIIPILNRNHAYEHYIKANSWLSKYLPNFYQDIAVKSTPLSIQQPTLPMLNKLDKLAEKLQRGIMKRPTIETVEPSRLAFHPHDYRTEILRRYQQRLNDLGLTE